MRTFVSMARIVVEGLFICQIPSDNLIVLSIIKISDVAENQKSSSAKLPAEARTVCQKIAALQNVERG